MVAVLFARADSIYKSLQGLDVFDVERDARTFAGGCPVVAHPPCRAWGRLRAFAKPRDDENGLARFAVRMVRECGGVLEHPACSTLWEDMGLPHPRTPEFDEWGGWSIEVYQSWFGHRAEKRTWLYIAGVKPRGLPAVPLRLGEAECVIASRKGGRKEVTKREREATPEDFARWLVDLAGRCEVDE